MSSNTRRLKDRLDLCSINTGTLGYQTPISETIEAVARQGYGAICPWRRELEGVDTAKLRKGMNDILNKHDIETIAPGYGCILRGKKTVEKHIKLVDDVLKSLDKSVATSRYVSRDEER